MLAPARASKMKGEGMSNGNVTALRKLSGKNILLIEDEAPIARDLVRAFEAAGARVVGPAASVQSGMELLMANAQLDAAVLDINLGHEKVWALADALITRRVPFVFATGYSPEIIPSRFYGYASWEKPVSPGRLADLLMAF
jgi:CheY-like chemotaxis protein